MENWRKIENYPMYSVSDKGRVWNDRDDREIAGCLDRSNGYLVVNLYNEFGHHKVAVHRLVANAFIPNPENKRTVNHIDCNKTNNDISNLEWANDSEQMIHAFANGLCEKTRAQAYSNLICHGKYIPTEKDRQRSRERLIAMNKSQQRSDREREISRRNINSPKCRAAANESHYNRHPPIRCIETGEIWRSQRELANSLGIEESHICAVLHGRKSHAKGYHFEYVR